MILQLTFYYDMSSVNVIVKIKQSLFLSLIVSLIFLFSSASLSYIVLMTLKKLKTWKLSVNESTLTRLRRFL